MAAGGFAPAAKINSKPIQLTAFYVMVKVILETPFHPRTVSVAVITTTVAVAGVVGVPEIAPVEAFKDKPVGNAPVVTA